MNPERHENQPQPKIELLGIVSDVSSFIPNNADKQKSELKKQGRLIIKHESPELFVDKFKKDGLTCYTICDSLNGLPNYSLTHASNNPDDLQTVTVWNYCSTFDFDFMDKPILTSTRTKFHLKDKKIYIYKINC